MWIFETSKNKKLIKILIPTLIKFTFSCPQSIKFMRFLLNCRENHEPWLIFLKIFVAIFAPLQWVFSPSGFPVNFSFGQHPFKVWEFFVPCDSAIRIHSWLLRPCRFLSWAVLFPAILSLSASFLIFSDCWSLFFKKLNFSHNLYCRINDFDFGKGVMVPMFSCSKRRYDAWQNFFGWVLIIIFGWWVGMRDGFCSCWDWDPRLAPWCTVRDVPIDAVCTGIGCCYDSLIDLRGLRVEAKINYLNFINFFYKWEINNRSTRRRAFKTTNDSALSESSKSKTNKTIKLFTRWKWTGC